MKYRLLAVPMLLAFSCNKPVTNAFDPVVFECGAMKLAPGQGAIKLTTPAALDSKNSPFDVFTVNGKSSSVQLSEKLCVPIEAGDNQIVGIGSNSLNIYFYDRVGVQQGKVTPVSLRSLEAPEFSMACQGEIIAPTLIPFKLSKGWTLAPGFSTQFSLLPQSQTSSVPTTSHLINSEDQLFLMASAGSSIPEGSYTLSGAIKHPVLDRSFEIKQISSCKLTIDRSAPKISLPAFDVSDSRPRSELFLVKLESSVSIAVTDEIDASPKIEVRLFEVDGASQNLVATIEGTSFTFPSQRAYRAEISATDKAGNQTILNAFFDVDGSKPTIILPQRRSFRSGEIANIPFSGASKLIYCFSEVNKPSCKEVGKDYSKFEASGTSEDLFNFSSGEVGTHILSLYAEDRAGNKSEAYDFVYEIDDTPPNFEFVNVSRKNGGIQPVKFVMRNARFKIAVEDPQATISCLILWVGGDPLTCDFDGTNVRIPLPFPDLALTYDVRVTATDAAGNETTKQLILVYNTGEKFLDICNRPQIPNVTKYTIEMLMWSTGTSTCDDAYTAIKAIDYDFQFPATDGTFDLNLFTEFSNFPRWHLNGIKILDTAPFALMNSEIIELNDSNIHFISPITNSRKLTYLSLHGVKLEDPHALSSFQELTFLDVGSSGIDPTNLGLKLPSSLETLLIGGNNLTDLSALSNLRSLKFLSASLNNVSDISPLRNLVSLVDLQLGWNKIEIVEPLSELVNLKTLALEGMPITDLSSISQMQIETLELAYNSVPEMPTGIPASVTKVSTSGIGLREIEFVSQLTNLQVFESNTNAISRLSPLKSVATSLKRVSLRYNLVAWEGVHTNLAVFAEVEFPVLEFIDLSQANLNDLRPLRSLKEHVFVDLTGVTGISPENCPTDAGPFSVKEFCKLLTPQAPPIQ